MTAAGARETSLAARVVTAFAFVAVLVFALSIRLHGFDRPHSSGDSTLYVGLAFKLESQGMSGYNVRGIDVVTSRSGLSTSQAAAGKGNLLGGLESQGVTYFDQALHHIPYGFPIALVVSHHLFATGEPYYRVNRRVTERVAPGASGRASPRDLALSPEVAAKQFYALVVPLGFSLVLLVAVYLLAIALFKSRAIALVAMFLMAISPIDLLTSQTIWADDMTAALSTLGVVTYLYARSRELVWLALLAGLLLGVSSITKQNGAFVVIAICVWHVLVEHTNEWNRRSLQKLLFDKYLVVLGIGVAIVAAHWFWSVYVEYGSPFHRPDTGAVLAEATTSWYRIVTDRPWYVYLLGIPYQNPVFALAYALPVWIWLDRDQWRRTLLLVVWIAVFFLVLNVYLWDGGKEHRYMLPAYPAFAVAAAYVADRFRTNLDRRVGSYAGFIAIVVALIGAAYWSVTMGTNAVMNMSALMRIPF